MSIIGQRIKQRRKQLNMSADDVASLLGISRSTVFRYENGRIRKVPADILEKLAEILMTTPAYLIESHDYYIDKSAQDIDLSIRQNNTFKFDDNIILKETAYNYRTDNPYQSADKNILSDDNIKIAAMTEIYLSLNDEEKKRAYNFFKDISKQSKLEK
ncbi:helix-turn-helix domain-containing protein [Lacrimispora sp.]|uniref:helix-turn-helix domain-containing protein n=1 Tax=Lacrimispora sp. TaxID=2719234 RepID=UPI0032E41934